MNGENAMKDSTANVENLNQSTSNTKIVVTRTFGDQNLMELITEYVAEKIKRESKVTE